jgi:hypothetical protein
MVCQGGGVGYKWSSTAGFDFFDDGGHEFRPQTGRAVVFPAVNLDGNAVILLDTFIQTGSVEQILGFADRTFRPVGGASCRKPDFRRFITCHFSTPLLVRVMSFQGAHRFENPPRSLLLQRLLSYQPPFLTNFSDS